METQNTCRLCLLLAKILNQNANNACRGLQHVVSRTDLNYNTRTAALMVLVNYCRSKSCISSGAVVEWLACQTNNPKVASSNPGLTMCCVLEQSTLLDLLKSTQLCK